MFKSNELPWTGLNTINSTVIKIPSYNFSGNVSVLDTANGIMYTAKEFRDKMNDSITYNKSYLKRINKRRGELVSNKPFEIGEQTERFLNDCENKAREDISIANYNIMGSKNIRKLTKDLSNIKEVPISDFIKFDSGGVALCLWHTEKTGSLKYYPKTNSVHCYGCGNSGDVIDVVMQLQGVGFKEALSILKGE